MQPAIVYGRERENLIMAANMAMMLSPNGWTYKVDNTYFDYGQNWEWTTLIVNEGEQDPYG